MKRSLAPLAFGLTFASVALVASVYSAVTENPLWWVSAAIDAGLILFNLHMTQKARRFNADPSPSAQMAATAARIHQQIMMGQLTQSQARLAIGSTGYFVPPYWLIGPQTRPEVDSSRTEPFVGWKTLQVQSNKTGQLELMGAGMTPYGVDATAVCGRGSDHDCPDWNCSCGFYALRDAPTRPEIGWFRAEVELFGTVIEGEHGWRASRQRVLSMSAFRECQATAEEVSFYQTMVMGVGKSYLHGESHVSPTCGEPASGFQIDTTGKVWPVCAKHSPLGFATLADLTAKIGTEVRWIAEPKEIA